MMEMEPYPFFQEDMAKTGTTAAMEDLLMSSWGDLYQPRGFSDLLLPSPVFDPSPPPLMEYMLPWGVPPHDEPAIPPGATRGRELLDWPTPPVVIRAAAPVAPVDTHEPLPSALGRPRGDFLNYERSRRCADKRGASRAAGGRDTANIHRRVIEYLRTIPAAEKADKKAAEGSRCFRHMMRERQRREKLSQNYADLHSMIVPRPKVDKNSIVRSAAAYVRELRGAKESLQRRHQELRASLSGAISGATPEGATIRLRVGNPSSPIDSMIAALRRLKSMDVTARSIRSCAGARELSAVIDVDSKTLATTEVEKAVQGALKEVEWKVRGDQVGARLDRTGVATTTQLRPRVPYPIPASSSLASG